MEKRSLLQSFAIDKDGRVRSVDEVARGLACDCTCPCCGHQVMARQGEVREWHFAHAVETDCDGGLESALHLAAKQLLLENCGLSVPEIRIETEVRLPDGRVGKGTAFRPERWIDFQSVEAEKSIGTIRPDIVAVVGNSILFVEVAVTHFVDREKRAILEKLGVPTIEIDLASFQGEKWTWELLGEYVIENALHKRWLHLSEEETLRAEAHEAAIQAALCMPLPIREETNTPAPKAMRTRFWIGNRMVDAIERPFGIAVWSPYDPDLNALIKPIIRFLGGRWQPRFKNWLVPLDAKEWLFSELGKRASRPPERM
jgi:competence protein CoiA